MFNRKSLYIFIVTYLGVCIPVVSLADTFAVGSKTMPIDAGHGNPIQRQARAITVTTAEAPGVVHSCNENNHSAACRSSFPQRDRQAEVALTDRLYKQHVQATIIRPDPNNECIDTAAVGELS